jgi:hypothetical protein
MRIALFEEEEGNARASSAAWPGDRVETKALLMPGSPPTAPPSTTTIHDGFVPARPSEPLVTASAAGAALLAVLVLTAGSGAVTSVVALLLFW